MKMMETPRSDPVELVEVPRQPVEQPTTPQKAAAVARGESVVIGGGEEETANLVLASSESTLSKPQHEHEEMTTTGKKTAGCCWGFMSKGSTSASAFALASATLGAGTLALPRAMHEAGWVAGTLTLVACWLLTVYSVYLLIVVLEKTKLRTYEAMARELLGPRWETFTALLIMAFLWGILIVYVVAIGDILEGLRHLRFFPQVLQGVWGRRLSSSLFWLVFMLPLSMLRDINSLRYAALIGMLSTGFLVLAICAHLYQEEEPFAYSQRMSTNLTPVNWSFSLIAAIPTFSFSFCCQTNCFEVYEEMADRSVSKMTRTTCISMFLATLAYFVAGVAGYADFGPDIDYNILKNYGDPTKTPYIAISFIAISTTVTTAYPVCLFPVRDSVVQLMGYPTVYDCPSRIRVAVCMLLAVSTMLAGLFIPNIGTLFGLLGGICGSSLGYVLPAVFALKAGDWTVAKVGWLHVLTTWFLLIFGIVVGVFGTCLDLYSHIKVQ